MDAGLLIVLSTVLNCFLFIVDSQLSPVDLATHVFVKPKKEVLLPDDIGKKWEKSEVSFEWRNEN